MGQKQCGKCGESVDEAKAFCPGCGHAFVDEKKRTSVSDYDRSNPTVAMGETMFNQLLSDMDLAIAKQPQAPPQTPPTPPMPKRRVEVVTPVVPSVQPPASASRKENVAPQPVPTPARSSARTWIIAAIIAAGLLVVLGAIIIVVAFILYFRLTG